MKKLLLVLFVIPAMVYAQSTTLIVDNRPGAPTGSHIYATFAEALTAANEGDVIQIAPSNTSYGNVTINKANITIYGAGINPDMDTHVKSYFGTTDINANGVKIGGMVCNLLRLGVGATANNIVIENTEVTSTTTVGTTTTVNGAIFRNCLFRGTVSTSSTLIATGSVSFNNCVFSYSVNSVAGQVTAYLETSFNNCLFHGPGVNYNAFSILLDCIVNNSIFYGRSPINAGSANSGNNTFNNCYAESTTTSNSFPASGGQGANNLVNIIPFVSTSWFSAGSGVALGLDWSMEWDVTLNPEATALIGGGNDNGNVGLTGGTIPYSKTAVSLPYVKSIQMPTIIRQGDQLNVLFDAKSN